MHKFKTIVLAILLLTCKSYEPFSSQKEKRIIKNKIRKQLSLSSQEYNEIKANDSLFYEINLSLKKENVPDELIKRRLDSFLLKKYDHKKIFLILLLDREFNKKGATIEFDNNRKEKKYPSFKSIQEMKDYLEKIKSNIKVKVKSTKKDSIKN